MFIVDGITNFLGTLTTAIVQLRQLDLIPDTPDVMYYDAYSIGNFVTYLSYFSFGLYLLLNPRPVMKLFFLPASRIEHADGLPELGSH